MGLSSSRTFSNRSSFGARHKALWLQVEGKTVPLHQLQDFYLEASYQNIEVKRIRNTWVLASKFINRGISNISIGNTLLPLNVTVHLLLVFLFK